MLVSCVAYRNGYKVADIGKERISEFLASRDCFVWVGLKDPDQDELEAMRREFHLHPLALEDARNGNQRPKIEEYGHSLFVVMHTVELAPDGSLVIGEVDIFVGPNYVLSVRNKTAQGFKDVRGRCEKEPELLKFGSGFVLYALMDAIVDRYFPVLDYFENQLEQIEEKIFAKTNEARLNIEEVYSFKRKFMVLQHTITSTLESVSKLHGRRVPQICEGMQVYFRDISDHIIRINRAIDGLREMTTTAMHVNLSIISQNESEVTKKLASYGALFALPTLIAGIYGMNFKSMPELDIGAGYPLCLLVMIVLDALLWWKFRKTKWL